MRLLKIMIPLFICMLMVFGSCSKDSDPATTTTTPPKDTTTVKPAELTTANVASFMVDSLATKETVALFYNLKLTSKTKFVVGQQDAFNGFYKNDNSMSDIKKTTGSDPGLLGSDFIFITDISNDGTADNWFFQQETNTIKQIKDAYSKGMINIMCWHIREPYAEKTFYVSDMTPEVKAKAFKSILPGGEKHEWYKKKLDKVASVFNNLKDDKGNLIPVIFRPFHEYDGSWFWWGKDFCTADEFKKGYQFTVDYLRKTKGVHNLLYALGPDNSYDTKEKYLSRYPGDDYVDILGMDNYGDLKGGAGQAGANTANKKLKVISDMAKDRVKIAAMTETGYEITTKNTPVSGWFSNFVYKTLTSNDIEIAFVMFWVNGGDNYYVPAPSCSNKQDFIDFTNKDEALLQNELPDMYTLPSK